jgi:CRP-like cAMP-binding protein
MNFETVKLSLFKNLKIEVYSQGETVFNSGEASNGKLYFLLEGQISIRVDGFSEAHTTMIEKGMFFGEISVINKLPRNETATILSGFARMIALQGADFTKAIVLNQSILKKLLDSSVNRLNTALNYYIFRRTSVEDSKNNEDVIQYNRKNLKNMLNQIHNPNSLFYRKDSIIYKDFDYCEGNFYVVESGQVATFRKYSENSEYLLIVTHEEGDIFGEQAFFSSDIRKEKAVVTSHNVRLREINKDTFNKLLHLKSEYFLYFIQMILLKVYKIEDKINRVQDSNSLE